MSLALTQNYSAISPGRGAQFLATGGVEPYTYAILPGGAGGSINPTTGSYQAPPQMGSTPPELFDTIQVTDDNADTATLKIMVGTALFLFCDVLQKEMGLSDGRVFLWDQKIFQPKDNDLYIAVSVPSAKPFGNTITNDGSGPGLESVQSVNMLATLDMDIMSRGPSARDRKEEIIMALNSVYAQQQQEACAFYIGKLPPGSRFINLSMIDGAAIPYRFRISVNLQYAVTKIKDVPYFDTFSDVQVTTNP